MSLDVPLEPGEVLARLCGSSTPDKADRRPVPRRRPWGDGLVLRLPGRPFAAALYLHVRPADGGGSVVAGELRARRVVVGVQVAAFLAIVVWAVIIRRWGAVVSVTLFTLLRRAARRAGGTDADALRAWLAETVTPPR